MASPLLFANDGSGEERGRDLIVVTSRNEIRITDNSDTKIFKPIGEFELPEYELQKLSFPPIRACSITFSAKIH